MRGKVSKKKSSRTITKNLQKSNRENLQALKDGLVNLMNFLSRLGILTAVVVQIVKWKSGKFFAQQIKIIFG